MIDAYKRLNLPLSDKKSLAAQSIYNFLINLIIIIFLLDLFSTFDKINFSVVAQMTVQIRHTIEYLQTPKGRKVSIIKLIGQLIHQLKFSLLC